MSQDYVNQFPIESFSLNTIHLAVLILGLIEFILLNLLIDTKRIYKFFLGIRAGDSKDHSRTKGTDSAPLVDQEKRVDRVLTRGDIDIVLRSIGMSLNSDEANFPASFDENDICDLFEEKSPSSDELKQAFDVFDDNGDGFIDATELKKVLCALGLKEGLEMESCRRMICVFDENGDGRIDFDEFENLFIYL